ncbi:MAG: hypothetical protein K2X47_20660 [Bdellovibrionales bacterium]|nr:hypothetical protein [Bdellovibrionales bacterium]
MKNFNFLTGALLMVMTSTAFATKDRGGGHLIEAGFRTKAIAILKEAVEFPERLKSEMSSKGLNVDALYAWANRPNSFKPKCAVGEDLAFLEAEEKMAYVRNADSRIVLLDCKNYSLETWQQIFVSTKSADETLVLHELLRVSKVDDDDYSISGVYQSASRQFRNLVQIRLYNLLTKAWARKSHGSCELNPDKILVGYKSYIAGGEHEAHFSVSDNVVLRIRIEIGALDIDTRQLILTGDVPPLVEHSRYQYPSAERKKEVIESDMRMIQQLLEFRLKVYKWAEQLGCP